MGRFLRPKRPMGRISKKGLRYCLRIDPENVLTKFRPISLTINEDIDRLTSPTLSLTSVHMKNASGY